MCIKCFINKKVGMKSILEGWFFYLLYSYGFIVDIDILKQINHRKSKCDNCPLKKGNWCSKKKYINNIVYVRKGFGCIKSAVEKISGCGCFLKAKYFSSFSTSKCPLKKWEY